MVVKKNLIEYNKSVFLWKVLVLNKIWEGQKVKVDIVAHTCTPSDLNTEAGEW